MDDSTHILSAGHAGNRTGSEPAPAAPPPVDRLIERLEIIEAHRRDQGPAREVAVAVLRGVSADLLEMEAHVAAALQDSLGSAPMTVEGYADYAEAMDCLLRLTKQVAQLTQLEVRYSPNVG